MLLLVIPIIIHLFNFRRIKKVEFSNIALLKKVKEESSAKRKPVEILILISRILFLAFLVFAFAQPISKEEENSLELSQSVLIYVDNSLSMSKPVSSQQNGLDLAFSFADNVIENYSVDTKFNLLENNYSSSMNVSYSKRTIKDRLTELDISSVSRSLNEIHQRIMSTDFKGDVFLISDFQGIDNYNFEDFQRDTLRNYYFLPIEIDDYANVHFDSAYLENTFLLDGLKNVMKVAIKNEGTIPLDQINLKLFIGEQLSGTANLTIDANGIVEQDFEIDRAAEFLNAVRLELDDSPVFFDNNLYLTLNNIEKLNIIEITEPSSGSFIDRLFSDNELFDLESFNSGNLDLNKLTNADLIVLNGLASISNQLTQALNTFLDGNGSVVVIPTSTNSTNTYANLGLNLVNDSKERLALNSPDMQNPFFNGIFEDDEENIAMPTATTSLRLRNISSTILNFRNGRAFLAKAERTGNLYFYSCGFDTELTSFPSHSLFVPVMYKIALGSNVNLNTLYYSTDQETIEYPLPQNFGSNKIVTLSNGIIEIIPDQRVSPDKLIMIIPKDQIKEGHYQLMTDGDVLGTVAFNNPKAESGNSTISGESFQNAVDLSEHLYLIQAASGLEVNKNLIEGVKGISLWKYAILFSLLFLFVEVILIRYL
jgi:aerotolerance regulator-like protein